MNAPGAPSGPAGRSDTLLTHLNRLTEYKNKAGYVSSALAWDDLTHMKLEAGKVVEARGKDAQYMCGRRVYDKVPRAQAIRNGWKIIQTRWIDINIGATKIRHTEADWWEMNACWLVPHCWKLAGSGFMRPLQWACA